MNVLLVEDEVPKMEDLQEFFLSRQRDWNIHLARSVRSAIDALRASSDFDLIVLDMSLPTFDITSAESGGVPQSFGGVEVLRYLQKMECKTTVVIVTAFEAFTSDSKTLTLEDMRLNLMSQFPENFRAAIYYNVIFKSWVQELEALLINIYPGNHANTTS